MNRPDIAAAVLAGDALLSLGRAALAGLLAIHAGAEMHRHLRRLAIGFLGLFGAFAAGTAAIVWWF